MAQIRIPGKDRLIDRKLRFSLTAGIAETSLRLECIREPSVTLAEIDLAIEVVGVAAGASTPDWVIGEVVKKIQALGETPATAP